MTAKKVVTMGFMLMLALAVFLSVAFTQDDDDDMKSESPMEGTWVFVSSTLPDGTVLKPPQIRGLMTLDDGWRNFNVYSQNKEGMVFTYSVISKYTVTDSTWTETMLFSSLFDEANEQPFDYTSDEETQTVPIKRDGMKMIIDFPFDPPTITFEGDKLTATLEGEFVDVWERIDD